MAKKFDPYDKWFQIPPGEQPPDHYRLLGVDRFESKPEVINEAAEQRVAFLHDVSTGPHVAVTQRLLNEVAAARLCLTDPEKKATYDAELKQPRPPKRRPKHAEKTIPVAAVVRPPEPTKAIPQAVPVATAPGKQHDEFSVLTDGPTGGSAAASQVASRPAKSSQPIWFAAGGAAALVLVLVIVIVAVSSNDDSHAKSSDKADGPTGVATRNIRSGAQRRGREQPQAARSPKNLSDAIKQHNSHQPQGLRPPSTLPTGTFSGDGNATAWNFGAGGLSDPRVSTNGLVLWLDAAEASTVSGAISIRRWTDKSGRGNDAAASPPVQSPKHRDRSINGKPAVEFASGQRLTVNRKSQLNLGTSYTIAFVAAGTGTLFSKGNASSDGPAKAFALQPSLSQLRFGKQNACVAESDNPSELKVRVAVADKKSVAWYVAGKPAGTYKGPHEVNNNSPLQFGRSKAGKSNSGFNGRLAEFLIYNRPIGDKERQKIEQYLSEKWLR